MAIDSDEIRSAATELLDAGAGASGDPLAPMRHSAAHMLAAAVILPMVGLVGGLSLGITGLSRMTEIKAASKQPGLDQAELDDLEQRRKSALGLEIAGPSLAFVTWSAGAILLVLSVTRDEHTRRVSRAPRWRVSPMMSRTHGGVNLTLRF